MTALADTLDAARRQQVPGDRAHRAGSAQRPAGAATGLVHTTDRIAATSPGPRRTAVAPRSLRRRSGRAGLVVHLVAARRAGPKLTVSASVRRCSADRRSSSTNRSAIGGATLRRDQGAGLMVMTPDIYEETRRHDRPVQPEPGELIDVQLPNDTGLDGAVVDDAIANLLVDPLATPEQTRIYVLAHLLALRQKSRLEGAPLQRHSVVIGDTGSRRARRRARRLDHRVDRRDPGACACDARRRGPAHRPAVIARRGATRHTADADGDQLEKRIFRQASCTTRSTPSHRCCRPTTATAAAGTISPDLLPTTALDDVDAEAMDAHRAELEQVHAPCKCRLRTP